MLVEEVGRIDMNCAFCLVYENMAISRAKPLFLSVLLVNHFTKRLQCFWGISLVQKYLYDLRNSVLAPQNRYSTIVPQRVRYCGDLPGHTRLRQESFPSKDRPIPCMFAPGTPCFCTLLRTHRAIHHTSTSERGYNPRVGRG